MTRPTAWLMARKASSLYHVSPVMKSFSFLCLELMYSFLILTLGSCRFGKGIPVTTTARAMLSEKSIPSATLPRHTAKRQMPPKLDEEPSPAAFRHSAIMVLNASFCLGSTKHALARIIFSHAPEQRQNSTHDSRT